MMVLLMLMACDSPLQYPEVTTAMMARLDPDRDGFITQEEYAQLAFDDEPIENYDTNGDGKLNSVEMEQLLLSVDPATMRQRRSQRPQRRHQ